MIYYWGCWKQAGHFLRGQRGESLRDQVECRKLRLPTPGQLDGTDIFLPKERKGVGALTYLPATDRTVLAWWGSPWDSRGAVNTAVIADGKLSVDEAWSLFIEMFPEVAMEIERPLFQEDTDR